MQKERAGINILINKIIFLLPGTWKKGTEDELVPVVFMNVCASIISSSL